ncbi:MAG TPA: protoglobin domain-containing protein [Planctomycetota bacterium]|nr:protoglobin domain-containing protein [Planctomycetota bacterium]
MISIGSFVLTDAEVAKRKAYLEITPEDEERLRAAHDVLQNHAASIIDRFYEYLLAHEHTRRMLSQPGLVERLKGMQAKYFEELTGGTYDLVYASNRVKVGLAHHRIGLSPEWYLGAYVKYLHIASDVLSSAYGRDYERFYQTIVSLNKIIYFDMGLALDAYHFSGKEGLERVQAAKKQLTDMVVHDLQNPLTGIISALQTLHGYAKGRPDEEVLEEALRRCNDLSIMIMNVLQVSRAESGELQTYVEQLDLSELARGVTEEFRRTAEREGRRIEVEGPASLPLRTDQTLLRRILQNLVRNALRHTPKGTRVVVRVDDDGGRGRVSVIDDGPGIPAAVQAKLFEPFGAAALRGSGLRVDTGLGLPSCHVLAKALGAELAVESDGTRGSAFILRLPASL